MLSRKASGGWRLEQSLHIPPLRLGIDVNQRIGNESASPSEPSIIDLLCESRLLAL